MPAAEKLPPDTMLRYTLLIERPFSSECDPDGTPFAEQAEHSPEEELLSELGLLGYISGDENPEGTVFEGAKIAVAREIVKPDPDEVHNQLIADVAALGGDEANEVDFNGLMRNIKLANEYAEDEEVDAELRDDLRSVVKRAKEAIGL